MHRIEMKHAGTSALHRFWSVLRAGRSAPYKAEVTAQGLGRTLASQVFMLESLPGGELRFRLAGSGLHDLFGMELRGMNALSVMEGESRSHFADLAKSALEDGSVIVARGLAAAGGEPALEVELLLAPLRSDFGRMDRLLGAVHVLSDAADVSPAPRRCRLTESALTGFASAEAAEPLPGFAEASAGFAGKKPVLKVAEGGAGPVRRGQRRRDHLRIVKE